MIPARPATSDGHRRGVTLLEVLLVLSLLVTLAAMSWPMLDRPLANQRLLKAADRVRTEWARARIEAMSTGQTLVFRYAIEGETYSIERHAGPEYSPESGSLVAEPSNAQASEPISLSGFQPKLPDGVTFLSGETDEDTRAASLNLESSAGGEMGWSDPILFYPDGTTSTARLVLNNEHDHRVQLSLRGLTGVVTVGASYSGEE